MLHSRIANVAWWPEFRLGLRDAGPVFLAFFPLGISFGMYAVALGLDWWWAPITALIVFAGSMEFLAAGMLVAATPLTTVATTALFVNARHVFYGLSVPLERIRNPLLRAYAIHALTDEAYALLAAKPRDELTGARMLAVAASHHFYWVASTTLGALAATMIPFDLSFMGFAMTALFVVLALEALKHNREFGLFALALAIAFGAALVVPELMLLVGLVVYSLAALLVAWLRRRGRGAPLVLPDAAARAGGRLRLGRGAGVRGAAVGRGVDTRVAGGDASEVVGADYRGADARGADASGAGADASGIGASGAEAGELGREPEEER